MFTAFVTPSVGEAVTAVCAWLLLVGAMASLRIVPTLVTGVVPLGNRASSFTVKLSAPVAPAARLPSDHVTPPLANTPPFEAETNVVRAGSASLITTLVSVRLPMFR